MNKDSWIFFDLGWTLVDETAAHLSRFEKLRGHAPQYSRLSDEDLMDLCERHAAEFARSPFLADLRSLDPTGWTSAKQVAQYDHSKERLYPNAVDVLQALQGSFQLGLIANQSAGTRERLQHFGISDAFAVVVASAEAGLSKPDPKIFTLAQKLAGCRPQEATMVGDRLDNDIRPAKAAGWRTIRVLQGFSKRQAPRDDAEVPDRTIATIGELPSALQWFEPPEPESAV